MSPVWGWPRKGRGAGVSPLYPCGGAGGSPLLLVVCPLPEAEPRRAVLAASFASAVCWSCWAPAPLFFTVQPVPAALPTKPGWPTLSLPTTAASGT